MRILVTGAAGFIGMHCAAALLRRGHSVVGLDNLNPYYDPKLKRARLKQLEGRPGFSFVFADIADAAALERAFAHSPFDCVLHLAAQAGVRYSLENPRAYVEANVAGFLNVLEACRRYRVAHLCYASSSSVYGANTETPFREEDRVDRPVSLYAATKRAGELMASVYARLFGLRCTGLRFFSVYGPWGRPDMALFLFTRAILEGRPIQLFNGGDMLRDFTYIDDVVEAVVRIVERPYPPEAPNARLLNVGHGSPVNLLDFVRALERTLGRRATVELAPMQPGDVQATCASTERLAAEIGYAPQTSVEEGVARFVAWYLDYHSGAADRGR